MTCVYVRAVVIRSSWPTCSPIRAHGTPVELPQGDTLSLSEQDGERVVTLADFVTLARSPVERDTYGSREIELVPDAEAPARFGTMLAALLEGLRVIGLDEPTAWRLVVKVALDSMPAPRRKLVEHLAAVAETTTKQAATALGLPTTTVRRTLEDLAAHAVVERESGGEGKADVWRLDPAKRHDYAVSTVPEMSETEVSLYTNHSNDDFSGKVSQR